MGFNLITESQVPNRIWSRKLFEKSSRLSGGGEVPMASFKMAFPIPLWKVVLEIFSSIQIFNEEYRVRFQLQMSKNFLWSSEEQMEEKICNV